MTEWGLALRASGETALAHQVNESKLASLNRLKELGLPAPRWTTTSVTRFFDSPDQCFRELDLLRYFVILAPHEDNMQRYRRAQQTKSDIPSFITSKLAKSEYQDYDIILQEAFKYLYGGNVVCDTQANVEVEMVAGDRGHNLLVTGRSSPEYTASRDQYTGSFKYSFENPELRQAVWRTILAIPHSYSEDHSLEFRDRGLRFRPGYYEFYLTRMEEVSSSNLNSEITPIECQQSSRQRPLHPLFIDTSDQPAFLPVFET